MRVKSYWGIAVDIYNNVDRRGEGPEYEFPPRSGRLIVRYLNRLRRFDKVFQKSFIYTREINPNRYIIRMTQNKKIRPIDEARKMVDARHIVKEYRYPFIDGVSVRAALNMLKHREGLSHLRFVTRRLGNELYFVWLDDSTNPIDWNAIKKSKL